MTPTLYLTNLARASAVKVGRSTRFAGQVGPGPVLGILRRPPGWASGLIQGHVVGLMPTHRELDAARSGSLPWPAYREALLARWGAAEGRGVYQPGCLTIAQVVDYHVAQAVPREQVHGWDGDYWAPGEGVPDGATLCCACQEAAGCHRSVAAEVLARNGWRVVLDGQVFELKGESDGSV